MKIFVFLIGLLFSSNLYADVCNIYNLTTREEVYEAQQCLKKEIKKSIQLAKDYNNYHDKVLDALLHYTDLKLECKKVEMLITYSNYNSDKKYYKRLLTRRIKQRNKGREDLRTLESQYGEIGTLYKRFKEQIKQLELGLEGIEFDYANILQK